MKDQYKHSLRVLGFFGHHGINIKAGIFVNGQKLYFFPSFFSDFFSFLKVLWFLFSPSSLSQKMAGQTFAGSGDGFDASDSNTRGRTGHFLLGGIGL